MAIITGASSGLGAAFARALAQKGWHLLLTGRREDRLLNLKRELEARYQSKVTIAVVDLSQAKELNTLLAQISHLDSIELLVNNAGFGYCHDFFKSDFRIQHEMLDVHITAATRIVYEVVPKMLAKKRGSIINVASLSAFMPTPLSYFYCASKAFLVAFSECLHVDLVHAGIKVQALCPGFTKTDFHQRSRGLQQRSWMNNQLLWMSAEKVVQCSLKELLKPQVICIPGRVNQLIYFLVRSVPKGIFYRLVANKTNRLLPTVSVLA